MLISPTEPKQLRDIGTTSLRPESYGADVLMLSRAGMVGIQRKEIDDLVSSIQVGGRLQEQLAKMNQLDIKIVLIEGRPQWTTDGYLQSRGTWTRKQHLGTIWSLQLMGFWVWEIASLAASVSILPSFEIWLKRDHGGLRVRPKVAAWGTRDNKDWAVGVLSQLPGVSMKRAEAIYDKVGLPLMWNPNVPIDALLEIDGIGEKTVEGIIKCLG